MPTFFHVTSVLNRESIRAHGLDWTRMGAARSIAGSTRPEVGGIFLCAEEFTVDFFVRMNNTGTSADVWQMDGVDPNSLLDNGHGFEYLPERVRPDQLTLVRMDVAAGW